MKDYIMALFLLLIHEFPAKILRKSLEYHWRF